MDDYTFANTITSENTMLVSECDDYGENPVEEDEEEEYDDYDVTGEVQQEEDGTAVDDNDGFSMVESMIGKYEDATELIRFDEFKMHLVELNSQWEEILGQTLLESETLLYRQRKDMQQNFDEERFELEAKTKEELDNAWDVAAANEKKLIEVQEKVQSDMTTIKTEMESRIQAIHDQMAAERDDVVQKAIQKERAKFEEEKKILFVNLNNNTNGEVAVASQNLQTSMTLAKKQADDELQSTITKLKAKHRLEIQRMRRNNQEKDVKVSDLKKQMEMDKDRAVEEAVQQIKDTMSDENNKQIELVKKSEAKNLETVTQRYERRLRNLQSEHGVELQRLRDEIEPEKEQLEKAYNDSLTTIQEEKEASMERANQMSMELDAMKEKEMEQMEELKTQLSEHITKLISKHEAEMEEMKRQHNEHITQKDTHYRNQMKKIKQVRDLAISNSESQIKLVKQKYERQIKEFKLASEKMIVQKDAEINALKKIEEEPTSKDDFDKRLDDIQSSYESQMAEEKANFEKNLLEQRNKLSFQKERAIKEAVQKALEEEEKRIASKKNHEVELKQMETKKSGKTIDVEAMIKVNEQSGKLIDVLTTEVEQLKIEIEHLKQQTKQMKNDHSGEECKVEEAISKIKECDIDLKILSPSYNSIKSPSKKNGKPISFKQNKREAPQDIMLNINNEDKPVTGTSPVCTNIHISSTSYRRNTTGSENQFNELSPISTEIVSPSNFETPVTDSKSNIANLENDAQNKGPGEIITPLRKNGGPSKKTGSANSKKSNNKRLSGGYSSVPIDPKEVKLLITNVSLTEKLKKMAMALQIQLEDDVMKATHIIAGDANHPLRRTPKLMAALCRTTNILSLDWLKDSYKQKTLAACSHYNLLIHDTALEEMYNISMKATLREGNQRYSEGGLFNDWLIYISQNVAGNRAPKKEEFQMIIQAAGGTMIDHSDLPLSYGKDRSHVIVITSDPPLPEQVGNILGRELAHDGAGFFSTTWLFQCIMQQKLSGIRRGLGKN